MNLYLEVLKKYAVFTGRAPRREYWTFTLFNVAIYALLWIVMIATFAFGGMLVVLLYYAYALATLLPAIAVSVRRLHDTGRSGWFMLLSLIPFVGACILLVFFCQKSDPGPNAYGPVPGEPDATFASAEVP